MKSSKAILLALIGTAGVWGGYKSWADRNDRYPTTQPTGGYHSHWWWGRHSGGYGGRSGGWYSSGHSSVSRGGFGHIGHGVGS